MSIFSNPSSGAKEAAEQYIAAILALLGDQDPLVVLEATPGWCEMETKGLGRTQLAFRETPWKWSIAGILQHLADSEIVFGYRIRRVLAEDRPDLPGFDQDLWADRLHYDRADRDLALGIFKGLRAHHVRLFRELSIIELDRVGVHAERGEESVRHLFRLYAGHDLVHRKQIERVRAAAKAAG